MSDLDKTVLIIDDEEIIRQSFADYFEDRLWRTLQAESGEEALTIMEKETTHCAIVDIRLGGMDGNSFIREACRKQPRMAFVVCTGSPEYSVPEDVREMACVSTQVFKKPLTDIAEIEKDLLRLMAELQGKKVQ